MLIVSVSSHATLPEREQRNFVNNQPLSTRLPGGHVENSRPPKRFYLFVVVLDFNVRNNSDVNCSFQFTCGKQESQEADNFSVNRTKLDRVTALQARRWATRLTGHSLTLFVLWLRISFQSPALSTYTLQSCGRAATSDSAPARVMFVRVT